MEIRTYQTHLIVYSTDLCVSLVKLTVDTLRFLLHN